MTLTFILLFLPHIYSEHVCTPTLAMPQNELKPTSYRLGTERVINLTTRLKR